MEKQNLTKAQVKENIETKLSRYFGCSPDEASKDQMYKAVSMTIRDMLSSKRNDFKHAVNAVGSKRVYYMCMEFLLGRSLKTNLCNLGLDKTYADALKEYGIALDELYTCEPMRDSETAVSEDLLLALWTLSRRLIILQRDFLFAMSMDSLSR